MIRNGFQRSNTTSPVLRLAGLALIASIMFVASSAGAQIALGTAATYGVLAGSTVTNTGATTVNGNLGVSPGTAVTGFPPGVVVPPGVIHAGDASAAQAQADLTTAYNAVAGTPTLVDLTGFDLGGLTLTPGVYGFSSSAQLTGTLTLDAQGNPNALFLFKIGTTLTTASGSSVVMINGGSGCNVYWQTGSSATLGTGTALIGNILSLASITLNTGATLGGRALARNGAVTLDGAIVSVCSSAPSSCPAITVNPATLPPASVGTPYSQLVTASGGTGPYAFAVTSGAIPPGLTLNPATGLLTGTPTSSGTYNFTITATDANACPGSRAYVLLIPAGVCPVITISPAQLPAPMLGARYSQTISATGDVAPYSFAITSGALPPGLFLDGATGKILGTPIALGNYNFTVTATSAGGCQAAKSYSLLVLPALLPPDPIPTLSEWGLIMLIALMALLGSRRVIRRR